MSDWSTYFPFAKGDKLYIDGPFIYNGSGEVVENDGGSLELTISMPRLSIAGIPKIDAHVLIEHKADGEGNLLAISMNDIEIKDSNATIESGGATRRIIPSLGDKGVDITRQGDKASLKVQGREFTVSRAK